MPKLGDELERMHPRIYNGVARQICRNPGGEFHTPDAVSLLLGAVGRELFRVEITWSKVISLFAIAGGLSVDCVRQGHPEYLPKLMESVSEVIEDELVPWINENGGWVSFSDHFVIVEDSFQWFSILEWHQHTRFTHYQQPESFRVDHFGYRRSFWPNSSFYDSAIYI